MSQSLLPFDISLISPVSNQWAGVGPGPLANLAQFINTFGSDIEYITFNGSWNFETNVSFKMDFAADVPGSFNGWKVNLRFRYTGTAPNATLTIRVGAAGPGLSTIIQVIDSLTAPGAFNTIEYPISAIEAASIGATIQYIVAFEQTADTDPFPMWDIATVELIIADGGTPADIEVIGSGGVEVNSFAATFDNMITGSGGVEVNGAAVLVLSVNASGIYTLIPNKTDDTLYQRASSEDTIDVKIPNPFVKTAYLGG